MKSKAYIKKDKDHDVLGNPITSKGWKDYFKQFPNRAKLEVPEKDLDIVLINGFKFFRNGSQFQCATCLNSMGLMAMENKDKAIGRTRRVILTKECDCPKQK